MGGWVSGVGEWIGGSLIPVMCNPHPLPCVFPFPLESSLWYLINCCVSFDHRGPIVHRPPHLCFFCRLPLYVTWFVSLFSYQSVAAVCLLRAFFFLSFFSSPSRKHLPQTAPLPPAKALEQPAAKGRGRCQHSRWDLYCAVLWYDGLPQTPRLPVTHLPVSIVCIDRAT